MYLIRLDDASDKMDVQKWNKIEKILDEFNIKPIVGIIPNNLDKEFCKYDCDKKFWSKALKWQNKGWTIAMHGFEHVYHTNDGGINPINNRSEFAGLQLAVQKEKIRKGYNILIEKKLKPSIFFAPSHTFDKNTLIAIKKETDINIISDTIANDIYFENDFFFIPQQSGCVRFLPFKIVTFCYHPNIMNQNDFNKLKLFINKHKNKFISVDELNMHKRNKNIYDRLLSKLYFARRK